jgi:hypothetical protein
VVRKKALSIIHRSFWLSEPGNKCNHETQKIVNAPRVRAHDPPPGIKLLAGLPKLIKYPVRVLFSPCKIFGVHHRNLRLLTTVYFSDVVQEKKVTS